MYEYMADVGFLNAVYRYDDEGKWDEQFHAKVQRLFDCAGF